MSELICSEIRNRPIFDNIEQIRLAGVICCKTRNVARCEGGAFLSGWRLVDQQVALDLPIAVKNEMMLDHLTEDGARFQVEGPAVLRRLGWNYIDRLFRILDVKSRQTEVAEGPYGGTIADRPEMFEEVSESWRVLTRRDRTVGTPNITQFLAPALNDLRDEPLGDGGTTLDNVEAPEQHWKLYVTLPLIEIDRWFRSIGNFTLRVGSLLEAIFGMVLRGVALTSACFQECTSKWCCCVADPALMKSHLFRVRRCVLRSLRWWSDTFYFDVQLQV